MKPRVGVVLSGCGVYDGAEIHESVLTLLALDRALPISADDVVLGEEVAALCDRRGARLVELVGHRAPDDRWVPADQPGLTLVDVVPGVAGTDLYVCGPEGFMASVLADARAAGVPEERIHTEAFGFAA